MPGTAVTVEFSFPPIKAGGTKLYFKADGKVVRMDMNHTAKAGPIHCVGIASQFGVPTRFPVGTINHKTLDN
jgi:hypothetical protein